MSSKAQSEQQMLFVIWRVDQGRLHITGQNRQNAGPIAFASRMQAQKFVDINAEAAKDRDVRAECRIEEWTAQQIREACQTSEWSRLWTVSNDGGYPIRFTALCLPEKEHETNQ